MDEQPPLDPYRHPYPARPVSYIPGTAPLPDPTQISGTAEIMPVTASFPASSYPASSLPAPSVPAAEQVIAQIGDIQVTSTMIRTPAGQFPLRGARWEVTDQFMTEQKTATWAIVMAIVLLCPSGFLSLLFLLVRETVYRGVVQVQVSNGPHQYVSRIPISDYTYVQYVYQQVNYVRSLSVM